MKIALLSFGIPCYIFLAFFIYFQNTHRHVLSTIFKGLASLCFFLLPIVGLIILKLDISIKETIYLFIGLGFGVIGDVLLNLKDLFKKPIKTYLLLSGVIAFFIGHVFYLIHLISIIAMMTYFQKELSFIPVLVAIVIVLFFIILVDKFIDKDKNSKIVAIAYISIISLLACFATFNFISSLDGYPAHFNYFITMLVACIGFACSDIILIFNTFGKHPRPWISALNLGLYYSVQILIGVSIIFFYQ